MKKIHANFLEPSQQQINSLLELYQTGKYTDTEKLSLSITEEFPKHPFAWKVLAAVLKQNGRISESLVASQKSVQLDPQDAEAHNNLGSILLELGRLDEAETSYTQAIVLKPDYAEAYYNLGVILQKLGRLDEAEASYRQAITLKPDYAVAHNNLGVILQKLGRLNEAEASYRQAITLKPDYAEAHNNLSVMFKELGRLDEAESSCKKAIEFKPDHAEAYFNLAAIQNLLGRKDDSLVNYNHAYDLKPDTDFLLGELVHLKMSLCMWDDLPKLCHELTEKINNEKKVSSPFVLLSLIDDPAIHRKAAEIFSHSEFPKYDIFPKITRYHDHKVIKIGYFSADFKNHPVSSLSAELYEIHDRKKFEIHAFSFGEDTKDEFNIRIKKGVDHFHDVRLMSNHEVVKLARSLEIDIAIDLMGITKESRQSIFAMSVAPIQVNYLGYPSTMAVDYMDYLIADHTLIPDEKQKNYLEKIAYMPNSYQPNLSKRSIFEISPSRQEQKLPEKSFVFCCFNNQSKITPSTFAGWMRILKATNDSVLWLLVNSISAANNLKKEAIKFGINKDRLIFARHISNDEHLKRIQSADLFLDTSPYNAHTTASDALKMGLPVLTYIGKSFASRVAASLLKAVNLPELITATQEEYESLAIELATDSKKMKIIKNKLVDNLSTSPLYNTSLYIQHLEVAYLTMYKRYQNGLNPDYIEINTSADN